MPAERNGEKSSQAKTKENKPPRKPTQPACDPCHVRRVRCSHEQPCDHCRRLGLNCTYHKASQARRSTGKRIEALRESDRSEKQGFEGGPSQDGPSYPPPQSARQLQHPPHPHHLQHGETLPSLGAMRSAAAPSMFDGGRTSRVEGNIHPQLAATSGPFPFDGPPARLSRPPGTASPASANSVLMPPPEYKPGLESPKNFAPYQGASVGSPGTSSSSSSAQHSDAYMRHQHQRGYGHGSPQMGRGNMGAGQAGVSHGIFPPFLSPRTSQSLAAGSAHHFERQPGPRRPSNAGQGANGRFTNNPQHSNEGGSFVDHLMSRPTPITTSSSGTSGGSLIASNMQSQPQQQFPQAQQSAVSQAQTLNSNNLFQMVNPFENTFAANFRLPDLTTSLADSFLPNGTGASGFENDISLWEGMDLNNFPLISGDGSVTMLDAIGRLNPMGQTPASLDSGHHHGPASQAGSGPHDDSPPGSSAGDMHQALSDGILIPTLALFYERLGGIMPVFSRAWLYGRLDADHHRTDPQFGSMLLSMSALVAIQAQDTTDRASARNRRKKAVALLEQSSQMRGGLMFGKEPSLETTCTSFFFFASLFALNEHNAAWFRLREAVTLGHLAKLHEPSSYEGLPRDEQERRLRTYWLLAITERAYAIQYNHPITLTGNPRKRTAILRQQLGLKELADFPDLQLSIFDAVDETFVDCFLGKCLGKNCKTFTREKALELYAAFTRVGEERGSSTRGDDERVNGEGSSTSNGGGNTRDSSVAAGDNDPSFGRSAVQKADFEITRLWLQNRAWLIALSHSLLTIQDREEPLRVDHALHLARRTLDICNGLPLPAMEAHGIGFVLKLYDIASTLAILCKDEGVAQAIEDYSLPAQQGSPHSVVSPSATSGGRLATRLRTEILELLEAFAAFMREFLGGKHEFKEKLEGHINEFHASNPWTMLNYRTTTPDTRWNT
ncbi:hypothetical protein IE81DRAFT_367813 [Ceraceosorus guamensis]|uniref:Zn(2)-C6 fungal-type domain-containing protein n=1 Tax=Ceraceosorus guamensis TaxID=1522189 RepID=A0A316VXI4_9BASI|nr:hypothetical protein IE81DRAFT_367813 [Ceraceosorus guamensis]PWN41001.1 hypothetical protein IE81DRAFT_367813 [Ceraceosorus guamensis]